MIGKILNDRYKIIELIGRGGMAYVYKAQDLKLNRYVAVKILREEYTENEQFIKKFDRESQAAAGLSDPNIVSVYDVGVDHDVYFIVMEYVDGITLKQYLTQKGSLDYEEATNFIIDIAEALKCAHDHGSTPQPHHPPGHQAPEHHADVGSDAEGDGLRHCPGDQQRHHHDDESDNGVGALHFA